MSSEGADPGSDHDVEVKFKVYITSYNTFFLITA